MRIRRTVAVAREVLRRNQESALVCSAYERGSQRTNLSRLFTEGAIIDHRIGRIAIYVCHGRESPMHADRSCLSRSCLAETSHLICVTNCSKGHRPRERRHILQAGSNAAFQISSKEQGK